jgi:clan AA aspartic protease (TIGR02281 family)
MIRAAFTLLLALAARAADADSIPLKSENGELIVDVRVNDVISLPFVVDSGATDVSITADVFSTLRRTGTVSSKDIIGYQNYSLADGSSHTEPVFRIHSLRIGSIEVSNVECSVAPERGPLLLGRSFLARLPPPFTIDFQRHLLLIGEGSSAHTATQAASQSIVHQDSAPPPVVLPRVPPTSDSDPSDPDYACRAAQSFCRDEVPLCTEYRQDFLRQGRICYGVTDATPPEMVPNDQNDPDYSCRAAESFCKAGAALCATYRADFRRAGRICPGVTN